MVLCFKVPEIFLCNATLPEVSRIGNICWNETKSLYDFLEKEKKKKEKNETKSQRDFHHRQGENTHLVCGKCQLQVP